MIKEQLYLWFMGWAILMDAALMIVTGTLYNKPHLAEKLAERFGLEETG